MSQHEHFLHLLVEQIKEFDSLQEAIDSASEDEDVQFFLSYVATNEPETQISVVERPPEGSGTTPNTFS